MRPNRLRALLDAGEPTVGTHLLSTWPTLVELVGQAGNYDWLLSGFGVVGVEGCWETC
jgi:2-keto-3-deoxy-L-rhamnonate aldolase RhmA